MRARMRMQVSMVEGSGRGVPPLVLLVEVDWIVKLRSLVEKVQMEQGRQPRQLSVAEEGQGGGAEEIHRRGE